MMKGESRMMRPGVESGDAMRQRVSNPAPDDPDDVAAPAQRLLTLLDRVEEFVTQQSRRLAIMIETLETSSGDDAPLQQTQVEKWLQHREEERSAERRRIQEEGQLLIRAWKELEDEQRRLLGLRESLASHHTIPCGSAGKRSLTAEDTLGVEEMAVSQFQKLRREIQCHARRGGPT
jgi:hypothetical protein